RTGQGAEPTGRLAENRCEGSPHRVLARVVELPGERLGPCTRDDTRAAHHGAGECSWSRACGSDRTGAQVFQPGGSLPEESARKGVEPPHGAASSRIELSAQRPT